MADTIKCNCVHPFQDEKYGKGNRLYTTSTKSTPFVNRCTVCGATYAAPYKERKGKK